MEDIVGLIVTELNGKLHGFMTWGRIFDAIDEAELCNVIRKQLDKYKITSDAGVEVCYSLRDVSMYPKFFEALFYFSQQQIPFGPHYSEWRESKAVALQRGDEIFYLGVLS